jgi:SH3 domain protein
MKGRLLVLCLLALAAAAADAQTLYVSDRLEITLRTGTSTQHSIVRMLPSGTPLTVLEVDAGAGYTRVRTGEGTDGWVLSRYLMDRPAAREQLAALTARAQTLDGRTGELGTVVADLTEERDTLLAERDGLGAELEDVRAELERIRRLSAAAVELDTVNRELRSRLAAAEQAGDGLRAEIAVLKRNTQRDWFLAGAGVLLLGIVLGVVVPRLRVRRRSRWGDLH